MPAAWKKAGALSTADLVELAARSLDNVAVHRVTATALQNLGRHEEALKHSRRCAELHPELVRPIGTPAFLLGRPAELGRPGMAAVHDGDFDDAYFSFEAASRNGGDSRARAGVGRILVLRGNHEGAIEWYRRGSRLGPSGLTHHAWGISLTALGRLDEARAFGYVRNITGRRADAVRFFNRDGDLHPYTAPAICAAAPAGPESRELAWKWAREALKASRRRTRGTGS